MGASTFSGPLRAGTVKEGVYVATGGATLMQVFKWDMATLLLTAPTGVTTPLTLAAGTFDAIAYIPAGSSITNIYADVTVVLNQGTTAAIIAGTAVAGTQYVTTIDVKAAAARVNPTFTGVQLLAMNSSVVDTAATTASGIPLSAFFMRLTTIGTVATTGQGFLYVHYQQV